MTFETHASTCNGLTTSHECIEAAQHVLGQLDLVLDSYSDALDRPWHGCVYVDLPGGHRDYPLETLWRKACKHALYKGADASVLWVGHGLESIPLLSGCRPFSDGTPCSGPMSWSLVVAGHAAPGIRMSHGDYFCVLGGSSEQRARFRTTIGRFGACTIPSCLPRRRRDLNGEIVQALRTHGPMSKRGIARVVRARPSAVRYAIDVLAWAGHVQHVGTGWAFELVDTEEPEE